MGLLDFLFFMGAKEMSKMTKEATDHTPLDKKYPDAFDDGFGADYEDNGFNKFDDGYPDAFDNNFGTDYEENSFNKFDDRYSNW
ncbi:MAG: hypothetical protein IJ681_01955 [Bacteroidales bacterium]|nr:hypothetical protein [Bacteroidales bacterium]